MQGKDLLNGPNIFVKSAIKVNGGMDIPMDYQ